MNQAASFPPPRRWGMIFHLAAAGVLAAGAVWGLWRASQAVIGPLFLLYLLPGLAAAAATPLLAYRAAALRNATYTLERDGIRLRWGLRQEDIPIDRVLWVRPLEESRLALPLPWPRWPGAILGVRSLPDGGSLEYLAAGMESLVVIATRDGWYAVSPRDRAGFLHAYQRLAEMGSLYPLPRRSVHPSFLLARVWRSRSARLLLIGGAALNLAMLIWVSLAAAGQESVRLGGAGGDLVPPVRLLLLPVISGSFFFANLFLGLFFYRRGEVDISGEAPGHILAHILWSSALLCAALLLAGVGAILGASLY
jgi:hypothetical protein